MKVKSRGAPPKGGGIVFIQITPIRGALKPIQVVDEGLIRRVRGVAFCTKISPAIATRVVDSCRGVLNKFLPDVRIHVDHYQGGRGGGNSPGYSLSLVAETTTGVLLSVERTAKSRAPSVTNSADLSNFTQSEEKGESHVAGELPETIGREGGLLLLREIQKGGVIDSFHQPLVLLLMALTPEDVSKVRFGVLTQQSVRLLRLLKDSFGVIFKIRPDFQTSPGPNVPVETRRKRENTLTTSETTGKRKKTLGNSSESESENEGFNQGFEQNQHCDHLVDIDRATILLSCYGSGYANVSRKAT